MNKLKKKKAGIKDFFKGKHGRNFLLALDVLLAIAFFAQPDLYYNPQAPDFFDRFYADSLIICGGLWAVLVFLTVKKIHFSAEVNRILTYIAGIATPFIAFLWLEFYNDAQFWVPIFSIPFLYLVLDIIVYYVIYVLFLLILPYLKGSASLWILALSTIIIFWLAPYDHPNLHMTKEELAASRRMARLTVLILDMALILSLGAKFYAFANGIALGLGLTAFLLIVAHGKQKYKKGDM